MRAGAAEWFERFGDTAYPPFWRREFDIEDLGVLRHIYVEPDETVP